MVSSVKWQNSFKNTRKTYKGNNFSVCETAKSSRYLRPPTFSSPCNQACCRGKDPRWPAAGGQWRSWWSATCTGHISGALQLWMGWGTRGGRCLGGWWSTETNSALETLSQIKYPLVVFQSKYPIQQSPFFNKLWGLQIARSVFLHTCMLITGIHFVHFANKGETFLPFYPIKGITFCHFANKGDALCPCC